MNRNNEFDAINFISLKQKKINWRRNKKYMKISTRQEGNNKDFLYKKT